MINSSITNNLPAQLFEMADSSSSTPHASSTKISFNVKHNSHGNGGKAFSLNLSKSKGHIKGDLNPKPLSAFGTDESHKDQQKIELISGINVKTGTSIAHPSEVPITDSQDEKKDPLIIAPVPNKDWRNEIVRVRRGDGGRGKNVYLPGQEGNQQDMDLLEEKIKQEKKELQLGLNKGVDVKPSGVKQETHIQPKDEAKDHTLTEDENIRRALLRGDDTHVSSLVLPLPIKREGDDYLNEEEEEDEEFVEPITEEEAYRRDMFLRPDAPDLDAYERVPVEEFGAALLRGMGWKGSDNEGAKSNGKNRSGLSLRSREHAVDVETAAKRPALLGIGANPIASGPELGAWGKGAKPGPNGNLKAKERVYVPLIKVNRSTGKAVEEADKEEAEDNGRTKSRNDSARSQRDRTASPERSTHRDRDYSSKKRSDRDRYKDDRSYRDRERRGDSSRDKYREYDHDSRRSDDRYSSRRRHVGSSSTSYEDRRKVSAKDERGERSRSHRDRDYHDKDRQRSSRR